MTLFKQLNGFIAALALGLSALVQAGHNVEVDKHGVILAGHDAVAYFTEGKPVLGSPDFTATHNGATYRFSSAENRDVFAADPERYAPQYGGFCAYGLTFGKKFEVDGKAFEIVDGKLYVNKNRKVYKKWAKDISGNISTADEKWPVIEHTPAKDL